MCSNTNHCFNSKIKAAVSQFGIYAFIPISQVRMVTIKDAGKYMITFLLQIKWKKIIYVFFIWFELNVDVFLKLSLKRCKMYAFLSKSLSILSHAYANMK